MIMAVVRKLLDMTLGGAAEISGYVLAISTTWALALTLLDRAHVRIDSLYVLLPARICALLDILALVSFMVFAGFLTWEGWILFAQSYALDACRYCDNRGRRRDQRRCNQYLCLVPHYLLLLLWRLVERTASSDLACHQWRD
jgi:hypothetical protein